MNLSGATTRRVRVVPADQRLDADHLGALELVDRLVEQLELLLRALGRGAQVRFQLGPVLGTLVHARVEQDEAVLAGRLGGVQGQVGVAQQRVGVRVGPDRDPDADRPRGDLASVLELDRLAQDLGQAVGEQVQRRLAVLSARPARRTRRRRAGRPCPARGPTAAAALRRSSAAGLRPRGRSCR